MTPWEFFGVLGLGIGIGVAGTLAIVGYLVKRYLDKAVRGGM